MTEFQEFDWCMSISPCRFLSYLTACELFTSNDFLGGIARTELCRSTLPYSSSRMLRQYCVLLACELAILSAQVVVICSLLREDCSCVGGVTHPVRLAWMGVEPQNALGGCCPLCLCCAFFNHGIIRRTSRRHFIEHVCINRSYSCLAFANNALFLELVLDLGK